MPCGARGEQSSSPPLVEMLRRLKVAAVGRALRSRRHASTLGTVYYQGNSVPRSLTSTGLVGTTRDQSGSDGEFFGVSPAPTAVQIADGRQRR